MRASPALQVSLSHFGVWRVAVSALAWLAAGAVLAWACTSHPAQAHQPWAWATAVILATAALALGLSLGRVRPCSLRSDGQRWHLCSAQAGSDEQAGDLTVALDLGPWMLLRFVADGTAGHAAVRWLPLQRRGLEAQWHALRCAVYAPRAVPGSVAADF